MSMDPTDSENFAESIAVIGMAGRFPGAADVRAFWRNLVEGVESIRTMSEAEVLADGADPSLLENPDYIRARGLLDGVDQFDPAFFSYSPRDAAQIDPQHRLLLECAYEALEDSGYDPERFKGPIGVFAGQSLNTYLLHHLCADRAAIDELTSAYQVGQFPILTGNDKDYLSSRISYKLNLRGPSVAVQTACSTSLVAICQAVQSLLTYQCDIALAGGVAAAFPEYRGYIYQEGGIASPDGHCRAFDAQAQGTVFGAGSGLVVLKRLSEAIADGDRVDAVIRGAAINNDGSAKASFSAPSADGQADVIALAHALAGVDPESITFVEAHGTGTPLGDPIEVEGLTRAFRAGTDRKQFCVLGSVKTNIGHLESAAGVTGLIKTSLALKNRRIPGTLHYQKPNPRIDFASSPFYVTSETKDWADGPTPRRAGVSSFGVGGTNAHVVLEEAPVLMSQPSSKPDQLLVLSAKTRKALDQMSANLGQWLRDEPELDLADAAYTLQVGRKVYPHRRALTCRSREEAIVSLAASPSDKLGDPASPKSNPYVAFLFPGQGAQQVNMARSLYDTEPLFREIVVEGCDILTPLLGVDPRTILYPDNAAQASEEAGSPSDLLKQTRFTQPLLFLVEYALARLWMHWGVQPRAMIGHSLGEYTAACIAGVFSLQDALRLLAERGRLMQALPAGAMAVVCLSAEELATCLPAGVTIAAVNAPELCTVSGTFEQIEALERDMEEKRVTCKRLETSHAFHSPMMDPMLSAYRARLRAMTLHAPTIPYISNKTGTWITPEEATDPDYWVAHLRDTVLFQEGMAAILETRDAVLLEVGPGVVLTGLTRRNPAKNESHTLIVSLANSRKESGDKVTATEALGRLWQTGVEIDWSAYHGDDRRRRVSLPTYPFERIKCRIEAPARQESAATPQLGESNKATEHLIAVDKVATVEQMESTNRATETNMNHRQSEIEISLRDALHTMTGIEREGIDPTVSFLEMGLDSLFLTQASLKFQSKFKVRITFRHLLEDYPTIRDLAGFIDKQLPPAPKVETPAPVTIAQSVARPAAPLAIEQPVVQASVAAVAAPILQQQPVAGSAIERLMQQQLEVMAQQIALLRGDNAVPAQLAAPVVPQLAPVAVEAPKPLAAAPAETANGTAAPVVHGPFRPIAKTIDTGVTAQQQQVLDDIIARYTRKTGGSKEQTRKYRPRLADPRVVAGFRAIWKDMVYPIVAVRSSGARIWDVDDNEFVDVTMGFGTNLFGHSPSFLVEAAERQLKLGVEIGPQSALAGDVAERICRLIGMDRAALCNTGSEAVMVAMRLARTVTGRDKVAFFTGDYHGTFDEVLVRGSHKNGELRTLPIAPGIPQASVDSVLVLDYGTEESLQILREHAGELAAIMVEPVQSRNPDLQPAEFLRAVREITEQNGCALIFDEVITGFRCHTGGAQAHFGIRADIATYGKIIGGGMPIGVVAGKAEYMDALDGGQWEYGDGSFPEVGVTFFAGTFVRHPLALAGAVAALDRLEKEGAELLQTLSERTAYFADTLNNDFETQGIPIRIPYFSSICYLRYAAEWKWGSLLYFFLREKGLHIWEGRPFFLSTAHTDADVEFIIRVFRESLAEMRAGGFIPDVEPGNLKSIPRKSGIGAVADAKKNVAGTADDVAATFAPGTSPMTSAQRTVWLTSQMGKEASCSFNDSVAIELDGKLDEAALRLAFDQLVARHESLRTTFLPTGDIQNVAATGTVDVLRTDISHVADAEQQQQLDAILTAEVEKPFDLEVGPLLRVHIIQRSPISHVLGITAHHIVCDGWSFGVMINDLGQLYNANRTGSPADLDPAASFREYVQERSGRTSANSQIQVYWMEQMSAPLTALELPISQPRPSMNTYLGARKSRILASGEIDELKRMGSRLGATQFATLLAAYSAFLHRLTGQSDILIWVPAAGQALHENTDLVGQCVNLLPIRSRIHCETRFDEHLRTMQNTLLEAFEHQDFSLESLMQQVTVTRGNSRVQPPLVATTFNVDLFPTDLGFEGLTCRLGHSPRRYFQFDLGINILIVGSRIEVEFDYCTSLFDEERIERWMEAYANLLQAIAANPNIKLYELCDGLQWQEATNVSELPANVPQAATDRSTPFPMDAVEEQLIEIWKSVLDVTEIGPDDTFFELGGYSLLALRLYGLIEKSFGIRLPLPTIFQSRTVVTLAASLRERMGMPAGAASASEPILIPMQPTGSKTPLFLIHPDHGLVLFYQELAKYFAADRPVYGIQAAGLDGTEEPDSEIHDMATRYIKEILRAYPQGPYLIGGFSLGGVVAYEVAQQLRAQGKEVGNLILFDTYSPVADQQNLIDKPRIQRLFQHFHYMAEGRGKDKLGYFQHKVREFIHGKKPDWELAAEELKDSLSPERLQILRRVVLANEEGFMKYYPKPYEGNVTLIRATERSVFENDDPLLWWGENFTGELEIRQVPGAHLTIMKEPYVQETFEALRQSLDKAGL